MDQRQEPRRRINRESRANKYAAEARRYAIVLDLAALDPIVDGEDGVEECFFCGIPTGETVDPETTHRVRCVWQRAVTEAPKIRRALSNRLNYSTIDEAKRAAERAAERALAGEND